MTSLRAYRLAQFGQELVAADLPLPQPTGRQVLLRVEACGVCHSDLHIWDGYWDLGNGRKLPAALGGKILPLTMGHEVVGTVEACGSDARLPAGARRLVYPWIGCHACAVCAAGQEHLCQGKSQALGIFVDGGYATHILVPDERYLLGIGDLPPAAAATLACAGLTAYSALKKAGHLAADAPLLIMGAGGVGLTAIALAEAVTGMKPIVAEIDASRRAAALAAGAAQVIDPAEADAGKALLRASGGMAVAIDFVGASASFEFAYASLRKGGHLVLVGLLGGAVSLSLPLHVMRAVSVAGSYVGSLDELRELVELVQRLHPAPLPTTKRPLAEASAALADLKGGRVVGRQILVP